MKDKIICLEFKGNKKVRKYFKGYEICPRCKGKGILSISGMDNNFPEKKQKRTLIT